MVSEELGRDDLIERYQGMHDAWVDALAPDEPRRMAPLRPLRDQESGSCYASVVDEAVLRVQLP